MYYGVNTCTTPPRKVEGIPSVSTMFILSVDNKQEDAVRDCRTRLLRPDSRARTETGKKTVSFPYSADHEKDWQPFPVGQYFAISEGLNK